MSNEYFLEVEGATFHMDIIAKNREDAINKFIDYVFKSDFSLHCARSEIKILSEKEVKVPHVYTIKNEHAHAEIDVNVKVNRESVTMMAGDKALSFGLDDDGVLKVYVADAILGQCIFEANGYNHNYMLGVDWAVADDWTIKRGEYPETFRQYDEQVEECRGLMHRKNHDYGESWRAMRITSITDQIATKIQRIKKLENLFLEGKIHLIKSEGIEAEYRDIVNYCLFALIKLNEQGE